MSPFIFPDLCTLCCTEELHYDVCLGIFQTKSREWLIAFFPLWCQSLARSVPQQRGDLSTFFIYLKLLYANSYCFKWFSHKHYLKTLARSTSTLFSSLTNSFLFSNHILEILYIILFFYFFILINVFIPKCFAPPHSHTHTHIFVLFPLKQ